MWWLDSGGSSQGPVAWSCKQDTAASCFLQGGEVRAPMSDREFPGKALFQAVDLCAGACVCLRHRYLIDAYRIVWVLKGLEASGGGGGGNPG